MQQNVTQDNKESEFVENLVNLRRVAKVLKGGRKFSFSAIVIIGNRKGKVGYGLGKAGDVSDAIRKAVQNAHKKIISVTMYRNTVPHWIEGKYEKSKVLFKPASPGTGIIAGGPVRIILELAGYSDVLSKSIGSRNTINMVRATFDALEHMLSARNVAQARTKTLREFWSI